MYGDTEVMRRQAGQLREQGDAVRGLADQMVAQADGVPWSGRAADSMRERIRERAARLRTVADRHDAAAESMSLHLAAVEELKDAIDQVERRAQRLTDDGPGLGFEPPRSGHSDWLAVTLPAGTPGDQPQDQEVG